MHVAVLIIQLTSEYFFGRNVLVSLLRTVPKLESEMSVGSVCFLLHVCY